MKTEKVFFWASDYNTNSGEGRLGRLYINFYSKKFNVTPKKIKTSKIKIFNYKYLSPFCGIFYAWIYFIKKKKFIYLNYLPYWNFLIFLLLPPNCLIGPITGGSNYSKDSNDYYIRKFFFPLFYFFSNTILKFRFKSLIFSTDLLRKHLHDKIINKSVFNFVFNGIKLKKRNKRKNIFFLLYFRKHKNKHYNFLYNFINKLLKNKFSVVVIGDKMNLKGLKNYGYISHSRVLKLLNKSKYSVTSNENIFSFFTIDCINNDVKLLIDDKSFYKIKNYKNNFIKYNFKKNNLIKLDIK